MKGLGETDRVWLQNSAWALEGARGVPKNPGLGGKPLKYFYTQSSIVGKKGLSKPEEGGGQSENTEGKEGPA